MTFNDVILSSKIYNLFDQLSPDGKFQVLARLEFFDLGEIQELERGQIGLAFSAYPLGEEDLIREPA